MSSTTSRTRCGSSSVRVLGAGARGKSRGWVVGFCAATTRRPNIYLSYFGGFLIISIV